jgi:CRP-like cAMP-binding protein
MNIPRLFQGIEPNEYEILKERLKLYPRRLAGGEILVEEGEKTDMFWLLVSGSLQGARCYPDGGFDLVQLYAPDDVVCLDVVCTRSRRSLLQISSIEKSEIIAVNYDALTSSDPSKGKMHGVGREMIKANIVQLLADESMRKQYKIDVLYKKSLRARISTFLQHMREKTGSDTFDIGMDRERFAQYLGVNRSALSHELSLMRKDGLIEFRKSRFEIFFI